MEGKSAAAAALLSTLLVPLLLSQQPRAIVADHLSVAGSTTALFDACSGFLDLLSRRNMILLCNAILLIVLRNAGLLASPADARHDGDGAAGISTTTGFVTAGSPVESSRRRPHKTRSNIVVWRPSKLAVVAVLDADDNDDDDDDDRLRRRRPTQRHEPATAPTMAPSALSPAGEEKQSYDGLDDDHVSAGAIVMVEDAKISSPVSDSDHDHYAGEYTIGRGDDDDAEALDQCCGGDDDHDDVDDMNRRFEEFIANTKRKMQLESLQLQLVMKV